MKDGYLHRQERETYFSFKDLLARLRNFLEKDLLQIEKTSTGTLKIQQLGKGNEMPVYTNY
jgi:hypothetical protein